MRGGGGAWACTLGTFAGLGRGVGALPLEGVALTSSPTVTSSLALGCCFVGLPLRGTFMRPLAALWHP